MTVTGDGYFPFRGYRTWYRVIGEAAPGQLPLICLHGGPGAPHDYLEPYEQLAETGRQVVFYDQLGCGRSAIDVPHDASMWTVQLFVDELVELRRALDLPYVHVLGQSWGGMLAMEYALTQPEGLASLVIESSPSSMKLWVSEANRLRADLPSEVQATLIEHERAGTTDSQAYEEAMLVFYRRHVCRLEPWPDCLLRSFAKLQENPEVYNTMNGPSEFHVIGVIKDWDITDRLGEIAAPTLVLSGRHDEATPAIAEALHKGIRGSRWEIFEASSHMCHLEEPQACIAMVNDFLAEADTRASGIGAASN